MALLIPDTVLERSLCNVCSKFLSVKPVKIYPNGQIKCGRCSENNDDGIESVYNRIADAAIFKCVNRFEGCRKILYTFEVLEHEKKCKSNTHKCVICSRKIYMFNEITHFDEKHFENVLKKPSFKICKDENKKVFLFRKNDVLLTIKYYIINEEYIDIHCCAFPNSNVQVNFFLTSKSITKEVEKVASDDQDQHYTFYLKLEDLLEVEDQQISFEIITLPNFLLLQKPSNILKSNENDQVKNILEAIKYSKMVCSKKNLIFPRKLALTGTTNKNIKLSQDRTYLIKTCGEESYNIYLECYHCLNMLLPPNILLDGFFMKSGNYFFKICNACYYYQLSKNDMITLVPFHSIINDRSVSFLKSTYDFEDIRRYFRNLLPSSSYYIPINKDKNWKVCLRLHMGTYFVNLTSACRPSTNELKMIMTAYDKLPNIKIKGFILNEENKLVAELEEDANKTLSIPTGDLKCYFLINCKK